MPQKLGLPNYLDKETAANTLLFKAGEYAGFQISPRYNNKQHNFFLLESGEHWILNGGQLDWREEQGTLVEGQVYDVTFEGMKKIEKGQWKGTDSKNYELAVYSADEVEALIKKTGAKLRGKVSSSPKVKPEADDPEAADPKSDDEAESLEGLE